MKIHSIYDNESQCFDRYTVYYKGVGCTRGNLRMCLGLSEDPFHPQGVCQHSEGIVGPHNGKKITFDDLPKDCQTAVLQDME